MSRDVYVRTLFIQGARAALAAAIQKPNAKHPLPSGWPIRPTGCGKCRHAQERVRQLARVAWATWKHGRTFDADYALSKDAQPA